MEKSDIGKFIKKKCIDENLKINDLADALGVSRQTMYYHINKKNKKFLTEIEKILNIPSGTLEKI